MQDLQPTYAETELLRAIAQNTTSHGVPTTHRLAKILVVSDSSISNRKKTLKEKGYLNEHSALTEKAWQYLKRNGITISTEIPILGQVKAGRARPDEVYVELADNSRLVDIDGPTLKIPHLETQGEVFALEVIGQSMENEHIFEGDYVIVQRFNQTEPTPKQGELIVTKYLPFYDETEINLQELVDSGISEDDLEGPTVKFYYEKDGFYRLSWRKGFDTSEYTIVTKYPPLIIGRVIGVYRPIK
jgi:SOS-response transcriptional repressor LexA